jgi:hypothetical protein
MARAGDDEADLTGIAETRGDDRAGEYPLECGTYPVKHKTLVIIIR